MKTNRPSLPLSEMNESNLNAIAISLGCKSWRVMLRLIAEGELDVVKHGRVCGSGLPLKAEHPSDPKQLSWVEPKGPVYAEVPVVHSPYVKAIPFSENTCDTSEFDTPVPQRRPLASSEPVAMPKPISVSGPLSPEDKREMFDKLKGLLKKGSDL